MLVLNSNRRTVRTTCLRPCRRREGLILKEMVRLRGRVRLITLAIAAAPQTGRSSRDKLGVEIGSIHWEHPFTWGLPQTPKTAARETRLKSGNPLLPLASFAPGIAGELVVFRSLIVSA